MAYGIGMHLTDSRLVLVALEGGFGTTSLLQFQCLERPGASRDDLLSEAATILGGDWPDEPVVLALPASHSFIRRETLSVKGRLADLRQAVRLRLGDGLPCDPEELQCGEAMLGETEQGTEFLVAGYRKGVLTQSLESCRRKDVDVAGACLDGQLLWHAYMKCIPESVSEDALLLWHSRDALTFALSRHGRLTVLREIGLAGIPTERLPQRILWEVNRARLTEASGPLTVRYVDDSEVLKAALEQLRDAEVKPLQWSATLTNSLTGEERASFDRCAGIALGAALQSLNADPQVIDFRHGEFAHQGLSQRLRKPLLAAAIILCLLGTTVLTGQVIAHTCAHAYLDRIATERSHLWQGVYPDRAMPVDLKRTLTSELAKREEAFRAHLNVTRQVSALEMLKSLIGALPDEKGGVYCLDNVRITQDGVQFQGQTASFSRVDQIAAALRKVPDVTVRPEEMRVAGRGAGEGEVSFRMKLERMSDENRPDRRP